MLTPTIASFVSFFYPMGNTPAAHLTQGLSQETDADILLLGCGDVRNILFTAYNEPASASRKLDFTCCDLEVAIIARNVLLLSLILDNKHSDSIWSIQYDMYLDEATTSHLNHQAMKLHDLAQSLESWNASQYGSVLKFADRVTFAGVREKWATYDTSRLNSRDLKEYESRFDTWIKRSRSYSEHYDGVMAGARSAGPLGVQALPDVGKFHKHFWDNGTSSQIQASSSRYMPNSTLAPSKSDTFILHYGTDPLLAFGLAAGYAPLSKDEEKQVSFIESRDHKVIKTAKLPFERWVNAFKDLCDRDKIRVRVFTGDALALCGTLQCIRQNPGTIFANQYRGKLNFTPLILDGGEYSRTEGPVGPTLFNTIDTSNLSDHYGMLNILACTLPLLHKGLSSSVLTEILLKRGDSRRDTFKDLFCGDIATISAVLGTYALEHWTDNTAASYADEAIMSSASGSGQRQYRLSWKLPFAASLHTPDDCLTFDADILAKLLYEIYRNMFASSNMTTLFAGATLQGVVNQSKPHFHQGSFAFLLLSLKSRCCADWDTAIDKFLTFVENEGFMSMSMNYIQELYFQLHITGLYTAPALKELIRVPIHERFRTWKTMPVELSITLKIPRTSIRRLTSLQPRQIGTPELQCAQTSPAEGWQNIFAAVQCCFGVVKSLNEDCIEVQEDSAGWLGTAPLLVSFLAPATAIFKAPEDSRLSIGFRSTPMSFPLISYFGIAMELFGTSISDRDNVFITRYLPNLDGHPKMLAPGGGDRPRKEISLQAVTIQPKLTPGSFHLAGFVGRIVFRGAREQVLLKERAVVTSTQISSSKFLITIGETFRTELVFPTPVHGTQSKTRVARAASWIEIEVPVINPATQYGTFLSPCPLLLEGGTPVLWNMPRIRLDCLPPLDLSDPSKLQWIHRHVSSMFSPNERRLLDATLTAGGSPCKNERANLKDSLLLLFGHVVGHEIARSQIFGIVSHRSLDLEFVVFVSAVRLDLASHTVVLDTAIIPLDEKNKPHLSKLMATLAMQSVHSVKVDDGEMRLWKQLLPAFVERCREWSHKASCEYKLGGKIPRSTEPGHSPLCFCGFGKASVNGMPKEFAAEAKYAVRAPISPLFSMNLLADDPEFKGSAMQVASGGLSRCANCLKFEKQGEPLRKCAGCHAVSYCNRDCQRAHWKIHEKDCKK